MTHHFTPDSMLNMPLHAQQELWHTPILPPPLHQDYQHPLLVDYSYKRDAVCASGHLSSTQVGHMSDHAGHAPVGAKCKEHTFQLTFNTTASPSFEPSPIKTTDEDRASTSPPSADLSHPHPLISPQVDAIRQGTPSPNHLKYPLQ